MENKRNHSLVALLHGPDKSGLVARVAGWIYERGGNILHADQHRDGEAQVFFQRVEWTMPDGLETETARAFSAFATEELGMHVRVNITGNGEHLAKVALFVSKQDHCFYDLLQRFRAGDFSGKIGCVISNHEDLREPTEHEGLPFHYIPVTAENKAQAERAQLDVLHKTGIELIVLARYMQVLSADFLRHAGVPVINIHHSFLPAFAGGKPYHQAYARGVKLIGATAHYATADLDEGPIIAQDVARITHRHGIPDLVRRGKDLEKVVLAQAVRWHLDARILVYHNKTVVFD